MRLCHLSWSSEPVFVSSVHTLLLTHNEKAWLCRAEKLSRIFKHSFLLAISHTSIDIVQASCRQAIALKSPVRQSLPSSHLTLTQVPRLSYHHLLPTWH